MRNLGTDRLVWTLPAAPLACPLVSGGELAVQHRPGAADAVPRRLVEYMRRIGWPGRPGIHEVPQRGSSPRHKTTPIRPTRTGSRTLLGPITFGSVDVEASPGPQFCDLVGDVRVAQVDQQLADAQAGLLLGVPRWPMLMSVGTCPATPMVAVVIDDPCIAAIRPPSSSAGSAAHAAGLASIRHAHRTRYPGSQARR